MYKSVSVSFFPRRLTCTRTRNRGGPCRPWGPGPSSCPWSQQRLRWSSCCWGTLSSPCLSKKSTLLCLFWWFNCKHWTYKILKPVLPLLILEEWRRLAQSTERIHTVTTSKTRKRKQAWCVKLYENLYYKLPSPHISDTHTSRRRRRTEDRSSSRAEDQQQ